MIDIKISKRQCPGDSADRHDTGNEHGMATADERRLQLQHNDIPGKLRDNIGDQ